MNLRMRLARRVSNFCNFISIRCDYYVEKKMYEMSRHDGFPKDWFISDEQLEKLQERESIDNVDMDIELELGREQLGEE